MFQKIIAYSTGGYFIYSKTLRSAEQVQQYHEYYYFFQLSLFLSDVTTKKTFLIETTFQVQS